MGLCEVGVSAGEPKNPPKTQLRPRGQNQCTGHTGTNTWRGLTGWTRVGTREHVRSRDRASVNLEERPWKTATGSAQGNRSGLDGDKELVLMSRQSSQYIAEKEHRGKHHGIKRN